MARNPWLGTRSVLPVDRIRESLVVPSFTANCSITNQSLRFNARQSSSLLSSNSGAGFSLASAFTVEFWIKPDSAASVTEQYIFVNRRLLNSANQLAITLNDGKIVVYNVKSTATTSYTSNRRLNINQWNHVAVTYDGTTMRTYINTVVDTSTKTIAAPLDSGTGNLYGYIFGGDAAQTLLFTGWLDEFRIYNAAKTAQEIKNTYNHRRGATTDSTVIGMFRFDTSGITQPDTAGICASLTLPAVSSAQIYTDSGDYAPLIFGGSFVVLQHAVAIGTRCSLQYPNDPPTEDCDFELIVRWTDANGAVQRRKLWTVDGVDIAPTVADYTGEVLPEDTWYLEVWNIDGNSSVNLADDYTLYISITTKPQSTNDHTSVEAATLTANTTLAENLPLANFPLEFTTQQTY